MYSASIVVSKDCIVLNDLFSFEDKEFQNERASYSTKLVGDELIFEVVAKDSVALRSVFNTITKLLSVYEKTKLVLEKWKN